MTLHDDKDRPQQHQPPEPAPDPNPAPDPDPTEQRKEAAAEAAPRPDPLAPAVLFLLRNAKLQNRDLATIVNEHMRNIGNESAPPAPRENHEHDGDPLRQSRRFRGRTA